ncbi:K(+)/H(+) antiporter modulator KhtS, partial [Escherichia coli]|nr:K(+)/H(+) antiporter modulator KhtS [Escherichia coli]
SVRQLSVKPLDEPLINRLEKALAVPVKYQSNYLRI